MCRKLAGMPARGTAANGHNQFFVPRSLSATLKNVLKD